LFQSSDGSIERDRMSQRFSKKSDGNTLRKWILWLCLGTCNKMSQRTLKKFKEVGPGSKTAIWRKFRMNELIKSIFEHRTMLNAEIPLRMSSIDCWGNVPQNLKHWLKNNSTSSVVAFETALAEDWDKMCRIHLVLTAHLPKKCLRCDFD
jgi:hypothetical protein